MRLASTVKSCAILGALAASASAQSAPKVYGFADAGLTVLSTEHSFSKKYVGTDTVSLGLTHANLYFDFKPNERIGALVEVGLASRPRYVTQTESTQPSVITFAGNPVSDAQAKAILTQGAMQVEIEKLVAQGLDRATATGAIQAQQAVIAAGVAASFDPALAQLRASKASEEEVDKLGLSIERAQFDVNFRDEFKLRFGKFITPAGVWNVDHGSPVVLTVRQPLQTTVTPLFPESQIGMMGFGSVPVGDHDLNYAGYVSGGRIDGASSLIDPSRQHNLEKVTDLAYGGHVGLKLDLLRSVALGASYFNGPIRRKHLAMQLEFALEDLAAGGQAPRNVNFNDVYFRKEREMSVGGDLKVEVSNLLLQGELNYSHKENELVDGSGDLLGWYTLAAWTQPLGEDFSLTPYVMYESVSSEAEGAGTSATFNDGGLEGFNTIQAGLNLSLYTNVRLKTEYMILNFEQDKKTWMFKDVSESDLQAGIWSTQVSVAF